MKSLDRSPKRRRLASLAATTVLVTAIFSSPLQAEEPHWKKLRPAPQSGVACGFFANIPALALATDVEIQTSDAFVRSVYGLRRGDFMFQRSFDKRMFYELFALPYKSIEIEHPQGIQKYSLPHARKLILEQFEKGLSQGRVYSLRSRGAGGGPHNTLLLAKQHNKYVVHNPYPGSIDLLTLDELADRILVRSTTKQNRSKHIYVTHYLEVTLPPRTPSKPTSMRSLPAELEIHLTAAQRKKIAKAFTSKTKPTHNPDFANRITAYPEINFAALDETSARPRNVIGNDLPASKLRGVINLSKFTLNTWHMEKRPILPVLFLKGEPWTLVRYLAIDSDKPKTPNLVFDNGNELLWLSEDETLELFRNDGAVYGTIEIPWE